MLPVVLLDDDVHYSSIFSLRLQRVAEKLGFPCELRLCAESAEQVFTYAQAHPEGNLYFLDIELNEEMNGLAVARQLHLLDPHGYIVFITAYEHYIWDAMHAHVFDYLLKPLTDEAIAACLRGISRDRQKKPLSRYSLVVHSGTHTMMMNQEDILYIHVNGNYLTAVMQQSCPYQWYGRMRQVAPLLAEGMFMQINRSDWVALRHIQELDANDSCCVLSNGEILSVSRRRLAELRSALQGRAQQ